MRANRFFSFVIVTLSYLVALVGGLAVYLQFAGELWLRLLAADIAATLIIWVISLLFDNASIYDPYWSVQPIVILDILFVYAGQLNLGSLLLIAVINLWGVRLTANWAVTFRSLETQDWRYDLIRAKTGVFYPLVNLLGIQLMPTLIVFACILPAVTFITDGGGFTLITALGLAVSLCGITLEFLADRQMHAFQRSNPDRANIIRDGLWKHSRHPNYLGEILMWWGVFTVMASAIPAAWPLGAGALINTALFIAISIPMAERKLSGYKTDFAGYRRETRMLLPLPRLRETTDK